MEEVTTTHRLENNVLSIANCNVIAIFGPAATKWYGFLTKNVNLSGKNSTIVARVACDQFVFAPVNMGTPSPNLSTYSMRG
jgi:hypothetical protein